jgi:hypothetical protein
MEKIRATNLERYGCEHRFSSKHFRQTYNDYNTLKYGVSHAKQQHMVDILPLLNDYDWLFTQYINQNKTSVQIADELNISDLTVGNYLRKAEIDIKLTYHTSYRSNQWLDSLGITEREYQWHPTNKRVKSDGYDPTTNTIYEFHGDYWHGNPDVFPIEEYNKSTKCAFGELYERTKAREEEILALGYNLVVMWENDWIN